jgi:hypothetical protein
VTYTYNDTSYGIKSVIAGEDDYVIIIAVVAVEVVVVVVCLLF